MSKWGRTGAEQRSFLCFVGGPLPAAHTGALERVAEWGHAQWTDDVDMLAGQVSQRAIDNYDVDRLHRLRLIGRGFAMARDFSWLGPRGLEPFERRSGLLLQETFGEAFPERVTSNWTCIQGLVFLDNADAEQFLAMRHAVEHDRMWFVVAVAAEPLVLPKIRHFPELGLGHGSLVPNDPYVRYCPGKLTLRVYEGRPGH